MRALIDTCIIIDALQDRRPFADDARAVFYAAADCINAVDSCISDYEDAIMAESAARSGMDCIVTRNVSDYSLSKVPVYTPQEFLAALG